GASGRGRVNPAQDGRHVKRIDWQAEDAIDVARKVIGRDVASKHREVMLLHEGLKTETARPHRPHRQFNSRPRHQMRSKTLPPASLKRGDPDCALRPAPARPCGGDARGWNSADHRNRTEQYIPDGGRKEIEGKGREGA